MNQQTAVPAAGATMDKASHSPITASSPTSLCPDSASVTREEVLAVITLVYEWDSWIGLLSCISPGEGTVVIILISQRKKVSQERLSSLHCLT